MGPISMSILMSMGPISMVHRDYIYVYTYVYFYVYICMYICIYSGSKRSSVGNGKEVFLYLDTKAFFDLYLDRAAISHSSAGFQYI